MDGADGLNALNAEDLLEYDEYDRLVEEQAKRRAARLEEKCSEVEDDLSEDDNDGSGDLGSRQHDELTHEDKLEGPVEDDEDESMHERDDAVVEGSLETSQLHRCRRRTTTTTSRPPHGEMRSGALWFSGSIPRSASTRARTLLVRTPMLRSRPQMLLAHS